MNYILTYLSENQIKSQMETQQLLYFYDTKRQLPFKTVLNKVTLKKKRRFYKSKF